MALNLPRLPQSAPTHSELQVWWQQVVEQIEAQETRQDEMLADIATVQADQASQLAQIQATQRRDSISASHTVPSSILSAADAGSNATITIANHERHYGDETIKSVTGASITALAYSTRYSIYYDQADRAGGAVTFVATTDHKIARYNYVAGRHYCGEVTTPASGGTATTGGTEPTGGGGQLA